MVAGKHAKHPNVLSIEGVLPESLGFCTVSRWMDNQGVVRYVRNHPAANRLELVRPTLWYLRSFLLDVSWSGSLVASSIFMITE